MQVSKDVKTPWMSDEFWVSPYNFEETVTKRPGIPPKIIIHDTTLRDGEQTPGVIFPPEEKITIARMLDEIGVDRIEAGMPAVSEDNREAIKAIAGLGLKAEVYCSCPAGGRESDVDLAVSWGVDGILTSVPVGVPRLKYQHPNWTEDHIIDMAVRSISYAKSKGVKVTFICVEASRSERSFLERLLASVSKNASPDSVALYDTAGCLIPASAALMVKLVKEVTGLPVEIHYHNDLGLGLANTLAGIEAGAEIVHVTVNGLGERGGNVSLDELAIALHCLYGLETKIDYRRLTEISKLVERLSEIPLSRSKPIVSDGVYCRESGPGSGLVTKAPLAIFSLAPSAVGQTSRAVLGKMSGLESVETKLEELGIEAPLDREQKKILLGMIKSQALEKKGIIDDNEFRQMIAKVLDRANINL